MPKKFLALPQSEGVRRIDFQKAEVKKSGDGFVLVVTGTKPYLNMQVRLTPLVYIRQPEYWGIEVIGELDGIGLPATAPYTVAKDITHVLGMIGVEVLGAKKTKKIKVPY